MDTEILFAAARFGDAERVAALLAASAAMDATNANDDTPLHLAAQQGHTAVVKALRAAGAAVNATSANGSTPLHQVAWIGHTAVVEALLAAGAAMDATNANDDTPLHLAALQGHMAVVEALLAAGAAVDATDANGDTPLHLAAQQGRTAVVEALLAAGAAVDATNADGNTALGKAVTYIAKKEQTFEVGKGAMEVLLRWGAAVPTIYQSRFFLVGKRRQLRQFLDGAHWMSEQEREAAKAKWRVRGAQLVSKAVALPSAADRTLVALQAAYDSFVEQPETLTLGVLNRAVLAGRVVDVRGLRCAHQILVFADRLGCFVKCAAEETEARQLWYYERVYLPIIGNLEPDERSCVAVIVRHAARHNLLAAHHVSDMITALCLHATFHCELRKVNLRLNNLEAAVDNLGQHLLANVQELHRLQRQIQDKKEHDKKVARIKSTVKLGLCLAPLVGRLFDLSVDTVMAFAEGAPGATAMYQHLADPADVAAALKVIRCVRDAKESFTTDMQEGLAKMLSPFESLEAVLEDVGSVARVLGADAGVAAVDVAGVTAGMAGVMPGEPLLEVVDEHIAAVAEAANNVRSTVKEMGQDALMDNAAERAADQMRGRAAARSDPSPAQRAPTVGVLEAVPLTAAAGNSAARCFGALFFAGAANWGVDKVVAKLVAYVADTYAPSDRDAFAAAVRDGAAHNFVDGLAVVRCGAADVGQQVSNLLGTQWGTRSGTVLSVRRFFEDAKTYA